MSPRVLRVSDQLGQHSQTIYSKAGGGGVVFSGVVANICNARFGRERQESGVGYQILWNWKRLPSVALAILQMFTHLSQQPFQQICPLEGSEGPFFFQYGISYGSMWLFPGDMVRLVECLSSTHTAPSLTPSILYT